MPIHKAIYLNCLIFFSITAFSQPSSSGEIYLFKKLNYLKWGTVVIQTMHGNIDMQTGSAIIVKKGGKLFLVTCYHLLSGRKFADSS